MQANNVVSNSIGFGRSSENVSIGSAKIIYGQGVKMGSENVHFAKTTRQTYITKTCFRWRSIVVKCDQFNWTLLARTFAQEALLNSIVLKKRINQPPRETHLSRINNLLMEDGQVPTYGHVLMDINVLVIEDMVFSIYVHVVIEAHVSLDIKILPLINVSVLGQRFTPFKVCCMPKFRGFPKFQECHNFITRICSNCSPSFPR